jgi:hypothetical protein
VTFAPFAAAGAPLWMPDSASFLIVGDAEAEHGPEAVQAPVTPLERGDDDVVVRLARSGTAVAPTPLDAGWDALAVAADGTLGYVDDTGAFDTATSLDGVDRPDLVGDDAVSGASFAPGEEALVIVVGANGDDRGRIERLDPETGERTPLAPDGWRPRWLP